MRSIVLLLLVGLFSFLFIRMENNKALRRRDLAYQERSIRRVEASAPPMSTRTSWALKKPWRYSDRSTMPINHHNNNNNNTRYAWINRYDYVRRYYAWGTFFFFNSPWISLRKKKECIYNELLYVSHLISNKLIYLIFIDYGQSYRDDKLCEYLYEIDDFKIFAWIHIFHRLGFSSITTSSY